MTLKNLFRNKKSACSVLNWILVCNLYIVSTYNCIELNLFYKSRITKVVCFNIHRRQTNMLTCIEQWKYCSRLFVTKIQWLVTWKLLQLCSSYIFRTWCLFMEPKMVYRTCSQIETYCINRFKHNCTCCLLTFNLERRKRHALKGFSFVSK